MQTLHRLTRCLLLAGLLGAGYGQPAPTQAASPSIPPGPITSAPLPQAPAGPLLTPPLPPGCAGHTQTFTQNTGQTISDFSTITSTLAVAGIGPETWEVSAHTAISHTFPGDLNVYLLGPNQFGFRNTLTTRNGSGFDNVFANTTWTDQATLGATEVGFVNGVSHGLLIPEGAMGANHFHDPNGVWKLVVTDVALSDTGRLNSWSLTITTLPFMPIGDSQYLNSNPNLAIPQPGTITSTITVSNLGGRVDEVTVQMVVPYNHSGDLDIMLVAPNGLTTTLTSGNGAGFSDQFDGVTFTDDPVLSPGGPVTDANYVGGVNLQQAQPEGALGHFRGLNPNGPWRLVVHNGTLGGAGSLKSWQLGVHTSRCEALYLPLALR